MKTKFNFFPKGSYQYAFDIKFFTISSLILAALVVSQIWEYYDLRKLAAVNAKLEAERDAEYIKATIRKLISLADEGGGAIDEYYEVLNLKSQNQVRMVHSASIDAQYGPEPHELPINQKEVKALVDGKSLDWETEDFFIFVHPLKAGKECQSCHHLPDNLDMPVHVGYVLGLVEVIIPKTELKQVQSRLFRHATRTTGLFIILFFVYGIYWRSAALRESQKVGPGPQEKINR